MATGTLEAKNSAPNQSESPRQYARRVIGAYRTVAGVAARALARVPPADILAKKYHDVYFRVKEARARIREGMEIPGQILSAIWRDTEINNRMEGAASGTRTISPMSTGMDYPPPGGMARTARRT